MISSKCDNAIGVCLVMMVGLLWSCGGDDAETVQNTADRMIILKYLADSSISAKEHPSGIFYHTVTANPNGDTQGANGSILSVYFTAKVLGGKTFDGVTVSNGDPVKLKQGADAVYPTGLDIGLGEMKKGEKLVFYIPSLLGYGVFSFSSLIPSNAVLEIEVELVDIQNEVDIFTQEIAIIDNHILKEELNDIVKRPLDRVKYIAESQIYYKRLARGISGIALGDEDTTVSISYTAYTLDNEVFDEKHSGIVFELADVIEGLENGLRQMESGEKGLIIIPSQLAYRESVFVIPSYRKQAFADLDIIPQYAVQVNPFEVVIFQTTLLAN